MKSLQEQVTIIQSVLYDNNSYPERTVKRLNGDLVSIRKSKPDEVEVIAKVDEDEVVKVVKKLEDLEDTEETSDNVEESLDFELNLEMNMDKIFEEEETQEIPSGAVVYEEILEDLED